MARCCARSRGLAQLHESLSGAPGWIGSFDPSHLPQPQFVGHFLPLLHFRAQFVEEARYISDRPAFSQ